MIAENLAATRSAERSGRRSSGVPVRILVVLMLAVFTISLGFGGVLPLLPFLIERLLGPAGDAGQVSRATGMLTAIYTLALFFGAPLWGRLSDRIGRRVVLLTGLLGFAVTMLVFAFTEGLAGLYAERLISGAFAAAVTPVALALIADLAVTEAARARRLTFVSLAGISGFLLGPNLGVVLAAQGGFGVTAVAKSGSIALPLIATALLALLAATLIAMLVPRVVVPAMPIPRNLPRDGSQSALVRRLLILAFLVAAAVGVFEVGLALRGKQDLGLSPTQIAWMFTGCSLVMIVVQAVVFSPLIRPEATRWLLAPALAVLATGLLAVPCASDFDLMLAVTAAVAASAGILSPILTFWISTKADHAQGAAFGAQTAASSLGAAFGAAAGGLLFDATFLPNAAFLIIGGLILIGLLFSFRLPDLLKIPSTTPQGDQNVLSK